MSYSLILEDHTAGTRAVGDNVFLDDLSASYPVYLFYFPAETASLELERALRSLGERTDNNLFVNMALLNDPNFDKIARAFEIKSLPVVVITAVASLAALTDGAATTYVRLEGKALSSHEAAIANIEHLYLMFLRGEVAQALKDPARRTRKELLKKVGRFLVGAIKGLGAYFGSRDFTVSLVEGSFEIKKSVS